MLKLSKTSKLGCLSWSLQAFDTCPGSRGPNGTVVDACRACYARTGMYRFGAVKAVREANKEDWTRTEWVSEMVTALKNQKYFRWFDSGDMYSLSLARKMLDVMKLTPNTKHWLPTRMYKFGKFQAIIAEMEALPNVMVRRSSDSVTGEVLPQGGSTIIPDASNATTDMFVCGAYTRGGVCGTCRACWDKSVKTVAYVAHGATARKVIRLKLAA